MRHYPPLWRQMTCVQTGFGNQHLTNDVDICDRRSGIHYAAQFGRSSVSRGGENKLNHPTETTLDTIKPENLRFDLSVATSKARSSCLRYFIGRRDSQPRGWGTCSNKSSCMYTRFAGVETTHSDTNKQHADRWSSVDTKETLGGFFPAWHCIPSPPSRYPRKSRSRVLILFRGTASKQAAAAAARLCVVAVYAISSLARRPRDIMTLTCPTRKGSENQKGESEQTLENYSHYTGGGSLRPKVSVTRTLGSA